MVATDGETRRGLEVKNSYACVEKRNERSNVGSL